MAKRSASSPFRFVPAALCLLLPGCTRLVVNRVATALEATGPVLSGEEDPELVREAVPFGLKSLEGLLQASPAHPGLLQAAASGFTQYAHAFVLQDAQLLEETRPEAAREGTERARKLFRRAWTYGLRGLEARHPGFTERLAHDRTGATGRLGPKDLPLAYWTAVALGSHIALAKGDMAMVARLPEVEALATRALELDEAWGEGALHEFMAAYAAARGDLVRAERHLVRVQALAQGQKLAPLVAWAEGPCVARQDRKAFHEHLDRVLAFDPDRAPAHRLANLIAQRRARWLKSRAGDLFLED